VEYLSRHHTLSLQQETEQPKQDEPEIRWPGRRLVIILSECAIPGHRSFSFYGKEGDPGLVRYDPGYFRFLEWLALGIISLLQVEKFLNKCFRQNRVRIISYVFIFLCGYGIYLGRFLRFNSWDIVTNPVPLFSSVFHSILHPVQHTGAWAFTVIFSCMLGIIFTMVKQMQKSSTVDGS